MLPISLGLSFGCWARDGVHLARGAVGGGEGGGGGWVGRG